MKFVLPVFCAFLLFVSVLPCHDSIECSEHRAEQTANSHDHASDKEQCPPFCSCACCGLQLMEIQSPMFFEVPKTLAISTSQPSHYTAVLPAEISLSIWQPPKIS